MADGTKTARILDGKKVAAQIEAEVASVLNSFGKPHTDATTTGPTQIFNLGHGISQFTPPEHVAALVNAVHTHSRRLRQSA